MESMGTSGIVLLGLGPGDSELVTRQAWNILETCDELYLRTRRHPVVEHLPPRVHLHAFDELYEKGDRLEEVNENIVAHVLDLGRRPQGVVYAVPGHPFVGEDTCPEIARRARKEGLVLRVAGGMSFLEPAFTALGLDPLPRLSIIDALELASAHRPPFPPDAPALIAQIYSPLITAKIKPVLMSVYPGEHPIELVHTALAPAENVEKLPLNEIDKSQYIGPLTLLYMPPLGPGTSFEAFQELIAHLRAPEGCPWDREQTHQSLRSSLLEETYEVLAALDSNDPVSMREEFGDLLLQIVLHAQIANEYGEFSMAEVLQGIHSKIVRRHPHVFGDLQLRDAQGVLLNWERLKEQERASNGKAEASLLDGVALALPALVQAEQYQKRAARVGFDWPDIEGVLEKLDEEMQEVRLAGDDEARQDEIGDLLFAVVNLARWYKLDPESALRQANARFRRRFAYIEASAHAQGHSVADLTLDEMEDLWQESKRQV
jgi:tetrapyrrole methylase family protein/MazG family protein